MRSAVSVTMASCLSDMMDAGGELCRFQGGYWAPEKGARDHRGIPHPYHGTSTVEALVARGLAEYTQWQQRSRGDSKFPVRVKITVKATSTPNDIQKENAE